MPPEQTKNRQTHTIPSADRIPTMMTYRLTFLILLIFALLLTGCKKEPQSVPEEEYGKPEPVFQVIPEDINNADSYDQPRIQFVWQGPNREKPEIWSIKIDGTDLRLAADKDLLYQGKTKDMNILLHPVRSPDNRYILIQYSKFGYGDRIQLVDLKKQTNTYLTDCRIWRAPWVGDGQSFFCSSYHKLLRYYINTGKLEQTGEIPISVFYVLQNSERIVQMKKDGFRVLDFNGKEIRYEQLGEIMRTKYAVSKNGKYLMYEPVISSDYNHKSKIVFLDEPKKVFSKAFSVRAFSEQTSQYATNSRWQIITGDIKGNNEKVIYTKKGNDTYDDKNGYSFGRLTLYNDK